MRSRACSSASRISISTAPLRTRSAARVGEMVCRLATVFLLFAFGWNFLGAVDVFEQHKQAFGVRISDAIKHCLRFAPRRDETVLTHLGEVLRESRLAELHGIGEIANRHFACDHQSAQDQQTVFVGEQLEQARGPTSLACKLANAEVATNLRSPNRLHEHRGGAPLFSYC